MLFIYNLLIIMAAAGIRFCVPFSNKLRLFVQGRRHVMAAVKAYIQPSDRIIWFHAASLGEYEQGVPVMEAVREAFPMHKLVLTFFSPSGFEVRKNNTLSHLTLYLPLDTPSNASRFIDALKPEMVFFIKYEFWPNYLRTLKKRQIKTYLISAHFREKQIFFKWYGGFYRAALGAFTCFFVQNESSASLLNKIGFSQVVVSGDTRFDRVIAIKARGRDLSFMDLFKAGPPILVAGSTWEKDEDILVPYINNCGDAIKFVIAPHEINYERIQALQKKIGKKVSLYSKIEHSNMAETQVLIVDTVGLLAKVYAYADVAYVGGGFGSPGVHNVLEPAVYGVPVICGPHFSHFAEATALVDCGAMTSVQGFEEFKRTLDGLFDNEQARWQQGKLASTYVEANRNATAKILHKIKTDII
jgi:3-deoxy-D-manno-octulosonic-acid transferase